MKRKIRTKEIEVNKVLLEVKYCKSDEDCCIWEIQRIKSNEDLVSILDEEVLDYIEGCL